MGKSGSIQKDEPTLTDLRHPPDIDRETIDKAESQQESFPCLNLSESCQEESKDKTATSLQQLDPMPNILPQLEPEESTSKTVPINHPLLIEPESKTIPNNDLPHMESVSLSDGEDSKDENDEKTKVIVNDVITNDVVANDVRVNGEKYDSAFLLERIRELKDERDQVRILLNFALYNSVLHFGLFFIMSKVKVFFKQICIHNGSLNQWFSAFGGWRLTKY